MTARGRKRLFALNGFSLLLGFCCTFFPPSSFSNQRYTELDLKTAYIFNFMKFVEWPQEKSQRLSQINICAYSGDPMLPFLKKLEFEQVRNLKIVTQVYDSVADINRCQLIYLDVISADKRAEILEAIRDKPILSIGNEGRYRDDGEMITFFSDKNRLRFAINYHQTQQSGLQVSSRLLRLARVSEPPHDD